MSNTLDKRCLLGMLTPSSNTVLEPVVSNMLHGLAGVSAHFGRFPVTKISLDATALAQFDSRPMLEASRLLTDANVGVICWNGTSAGWLGLERDETLCKEITSMTGIPACSSVLALNEAFRLTGVRRFGLVTPYLDDVQAGIIATYSEAGFTCAAERHLGQSHNFGFSEIPPAQIARMCREVAAEGKPDAITIFCTNLNAAAAVPALEAELGVPVYDTVATAVWKSLAMAGGNPALVKGWGSLFAVAS